LREWSHSNLLRQSQSRTLDKAVSSDFASGGIQMGSGFYGSPSIAGPLCQ
jgi:hypothetical protein